MISTNFTPQRASSQSEERQLATIPAAVFHRFNVAIEQAHRAGNGRRVDRLLRRKMAILQQFHAPTAQPAPETGGYR